MGPLPSLSLLFLMLVSSSTVNGLKYLTFHLKDVVEVRNATVEEGATDGVWELKVSHRDAVSSPFRDSKATHSDLMSERLKRDEARVAAINARLQLSLSAAASTSTSEEREEEREERSPWADFKPQEGQTRDAMNVEGFTSPVVSGLTQGSGEYFTRLGVGTPPRQTFLVVDTGSDLSWLQCLPCGSCYQQSGAVFNPIASSSFSKVTCSSNMCTKLDVRGCQGSDCLYQVAYGDGSFTVGNFITETLTFGKGATVPSVGIGCGHQNEGLFIGAAGLLGLGGGSLSFPSQISSVIKGKFSYCLADREQSGISSLIFGKGATPANSRFTFLLKNPRMSTFYYVPLTGISVGGKLLPISKSQFSLASAGTGGVILDSGTSVTRLITPAYIAMRNAFREGTKNLPLAPSFALFDTCYNLSDRNSVDVPTVDLHFGGGSRVSLPAKNYLIPIDTMGTYCFAFAPTSGSLSIIGNLQQQGFRVSFDTVINRVGFAASQC